VYSSVNPLAIKINDLIHQFNKYIHFIWTSRYCNIKGNEEADKAARNAINNPNSKLFSFLSLFDIYRNVDIYCKNLWNLEWRQVTVIKLKQIKHSVELWPKLNCLDRKEEVIINKLRIGHSRATHGYLMGKIEPTICRSCNTSSTIKHTLVHCPTFTEDREEHQIPDNLYEAIGPYSDTKKIIMYL